MAEEIIQEIPPPPTPPPAGLKFETIGPDTARPLAQALQGPHEGRPAHPFAAEWKAIPGHFGRA